MIGVTFIAIKTPGVSLMLLLISVWYYLWRMLVTATVVLSIPAQNSRIKNDIIS